MSLVNCIQKANKVKRVFSSAEVQELTALAAENRKTMEGPEAERAAVQALLDEALAEQAEVAALIREAAPAVAEPKPAPAPAQAPAFPPAGEVAAVEPVAEKPAKQPAVKIGDFGEKLEGARKDYATTLKDAEDVDVSAEPLSKSWPEPDYQKLLDGGADPFVVAFIHAARDEVPTKPQKAWKLKGWVESVQTLRGAARGLLDGSISRAQLDSKLTLRAFDNVRRNVGSRAELYQLVGHEKSLKGITFAEHQYSLYKGQSNVRKWVVEQKAKATMFSNWPRELAVADTKEEMLEQFRARFAEPNATGKTAPAKGKFSVYTKRKQEGVFIGKKIGREYIDLKKLPDIASARKFLDENTAELETLLEKYKETPFERNPENQPRVGDDHRNGAPVTPKIFEDTFGFRGVQFGNYVEQARRQSDLNQGFDSLMDLAAVLGVPPRALSLNGRLGLAFGARGKGGTNAPAAHYEPGNVVINLTKNAGPGSLAHEWWHAVDNYFGKNDGGAAYGTGGTLTDKTRMAMRLAFNEVKSATQQGTLRRRAMELDKRKSKPYWDTPIELSARSFESYVIAKLKDQGAANDYLANVVSKEFWDAQEALRAGFLAEGKPAETYPYPTPDEVPAMRNAFDNFFRVVETRADDAGNVALFSRAPGASEETNDQSTAAAVNSGGMLSDDGLDAVRGADREGLSGVRGLRDRGGWNAEAAFSGGEFEGAAAQRGFSQSARNQPGRLNGRTGVPIADAEAVADAIRSAYPTGPQIVVVDEVSKAPEALLDQINNAQAANTVEGAYYKGKIYLFPQNVADIQRLMFVGAHHEIRHAGLDALFGKRKGALLLSIAMSNPKVAAAARAKMADGVADSMVAATEEALADMPLEDMAKLNGWDKIVAAVRQWLRGLADRLRRNNPKLAAMIEPDQWTDNDVAALIRRAEDISRGGTVPARSAGAVFSRADQTQTPAFRRWFGASKVVDAQGKPLVVYHGTDKDFSAFDITKMGDGAGHTTSFAGFFFSADAAVAGDFPAVKWEGWPLKRAALPGQNLMPVYLSISNPLTMTAKEFQQKWVRNKASGLELRAEAIDAGHDGIRITGDPAMAERMGGEEYGADAWVAFKPEQIKSATGNIGEFDPSNADIRFSRSAGTVNPENISRLGTQMASMGYEAGQVPNLQATRKLASLVKRLESGDITEGYFATAVKILSEQMAEVSDTKAANRLMKDRERGADIVREKLIRGRRQGDLDPDMVEFALWALDKNPDLASGLAISVRSQKDDAATGDYNPTAELIRMFKGVGEPDTAVHEIMHHAERMMPLDMQDAIRREWAKSLTAELKRATPEQRAALENIAGALAGDKASYKALTKAIQEGPLNYADHYQLVNPSEFWAVNASRLLGNRFRTERSVWGRIRNWMSEMVQKVRGILGMRSDAQVLRAMDYVIDPENFGMERGGRFESDAMLSDVRAIQASGGSLFNISRSAGTAKTTAQRQVTQAVRNTVADFLGNAGAKVSWWDKTLGTQYAKADKFPAYKRVFDQVQQYLEDTSAMANEAADQAKGILPKLETWKDLKNFGLKPADAKAIAAPIFTGTLTDQKVYDDADLAGRFKLTPAQIGQYRQFLATVNTSLDQAMAAEALRMLGDKNAALRELALTDRAALRAGINDFLTDQAVQAGEDMNAEGDARGKFTELRDDIAEKYRRIDDLKAQGYAPLMRFGKYKVNISDPKTGETLFFGLYESKAAANEAARDMRGDPQFAKAEFEQGVLSAEQYKLFSAMPLDSLEMFAEAIGAEKSEVYQDFIRLAKNNRSAMKRLLKRKGTAGFSEDVPRVLAAFVTSNARMAAGALNMPTAKEAAQNIRDGDVQDEAIKLLDVVQNPTDTAGAVRSLMFVNFIGGSIASAVVNLTQPLTMTLPYLAQFGGGVKAAKRLMAAGKMAASGKVDDLTLRVALKRAETDGIVSPQEIHHLQAQAMGTFGTHPLLQRAAFVWGAPFSLAEQFNRRVSFIAAFQTAREQGIEDAFGFAEKAVIETQGLYSKANAPNLARGTIGAAALTFKQFSIHYLEWMGRMWKSGPQGKKAVGLALALLILAAGTDGLPFADDLDDLVDTLGQALGYDMNVKRARREFVAEQLGLGDAAADVMARGFSAVPGVPLDVSLRMSMGNLLPGTGMFLRSNTDKSRDLLEIAGPAGGLAKQYIEAGTKALRGDIGGAVQSALPVALQNVAKAADMWATGEARDTLGRKVMDADAVDGLMKFIGFQPQAIARESEKIQMIRDSEQLAKNVEGEIASAWARAVVDKDPDGVADARAKLAQWNDDNPESPIRIKMQQIIQRARKLREDRASRFITSVSPERRRAVAEALE